ncbi:MAG: TetR/AcrR family transcriptional regulator [Gordonia sp. (in: high G+C Gram-positive bacteria)]
MGRPQGHGQGYEAKKQDIIDTAAALFAKNGYASTGTTELGYATGLAKGALYYYIKSKENLLVEIQDRVLGPLLENAATIRVLDLSAPARLRLISETLLDIIFARLDHIWVYEHDYRHLTGKNLKHFMARRHEFEMVIEGLIVEAMRDEYFEHVDPHLAMLEFFNLHNHTYQWLKPGITRWSATELSQTYCRTLFRGLATSGFDTEAIEAEVAAFRGSQISAKP